jgi:hypothetical protein
MWAGQVWAGLAQDDLEVDDLAGDDLEVGVRAADIPVAAGTAATDSASGQAGLNRRRHLVTAAAAKAALVAGYWSVGAGPWPAAAASPAAERTPHSRVGSAVVRPNAGRSRRDQGPENSRCKAETRPACRRRVVAGFPGRMPGLEAERRSGTGTRMRPPHPIGQFDATPFRNPAPLQPEADEVINMRQ